MKNLMLIVLISLNAGDATPDLVAIRTAYESAAMQKSGLARFNQMLAVAPSTPVIMCYRGAAEMMEAKYAFNPFNKLSAFGRGKKLIENGIAADSKNVECRFIRYSIQRNLPALLNYRDQLKSDSTLIVTQLDTIKDEDLKNRILKFMKQDQ